jgi:hypothetical protein
MFDVFCLQEERKKGLEEILNNASFNVENAIFLEYYFI